MRQKGGSAITVIPRSYRRAFTPYVAVLVCKSIAHTLHTHTHTHALGGISTNATHKHLINSTLFKYYHDLKPTAWSDCGWMDSNKRV